MPDQRRDWQDQRRDRGYQGGGDIVPVSEQNRMPQDLAAERSVLSAMILSRQVLQECLSQLSEDDFYLQANRIIYLTLRDMFDRAVEIDPVTLADRLRSEGQLERVGGTSYILELNNNTMSMVTWPQHVKMLRRDSTLRDIITASARISALAFDAPEDTKEVIDNAERMILSVTDRDIRSNYSTLEEVMANLYDELAESDGSGERGVLTGYPGIDARLQGLRPGQMIVIGARPGVGKTSFALNLAVNAAAKGASVAFFSLEMSKEEIGQRLLSSYAKIPLSVIRSGRIEDDNLWQPLFDATSELSQLDIMIDDTPGTTVTEVRAKARRMLHGKEKGLVILDYLQLVSPPSGRTRADSRATEVSEMSRGIKIMAKDIEVPVVALSQLSRQVESRTGKRPQLSDLRESGSIEQDADIVILLDRSTTPEEAEREDRPNENETHFIIAKNRSGPLDTVPLMFLPSSTKFVEVDMHHME